jgi:serine/threonine-protein kinase
MAELARLGRYELRRVLGKGAMGVVYEGFDPVLSRRVAVKTILKSVAIDAETSAAYSARFVREAQAVGRLNHPHIVQVHDFGEENEVAYLVMEYIEGRELRAFFDAGEKFEPAEAVRVMTELLEALDFAHEAGVIHRDVKPANVMLDAHRRVKLADFGVARLQDSAERSQAGTMVGTPAFMSPEQIKAGKIDRRTDIFSAGTILYQLLTGEQPFKGEGAWTVAKRIVEDDPPPPSSVALAVPPAFDAVVNKALAKLPAQRFVRAREFAVALKGALAGEQLPQAAPKPRAAADAKASDTELEFWRSIQNRDDLDELDLYVEQFPNGAYARLARLKIAKLREPQEALRRAAEETAKLEAQEKAKREAEERTRQEAEQRVRREAEERTRKEAELRAKREAEEAAKRAEAKARREAEERSKREAAERARRESEERARQAAALAKLKQREQAVARARAPDEDATVAIGKAATPPAQGKKPFAIPAIVGVVVIVAGVGAYMMLGRTPAPAPVATAPPAVVDKPAPVKPAAPAIDEAKIRRETEERLRKEFADRAAAQEKALAERLAAERLAVEKVAMAKTAAEKAAADKAAEKATADRIAAEKAAAARVAAEKATAEKAGAERIAAEKAAAEKLAAERSAAEKAAAEKLAAEKLAAEKAAAEKNAALKAAAAAKPGWPAVGDRWVYSVRETNRPEKHYDAPVDVQAVSATSIRDVFRPPSGGAVVLTHAAGVQFAGLAPGVASFSPYMRAFQEIRAGDRWPGIYPQNVGKCGTNPSVDCSASAQVAGRERVTVRAGTFEAWKIVVAMRARSLAGPLSTGFSSLEVTYTYWFADDVKRYVKYQSRAGGNWDQPDVDMELVSYAPAGAR